jgi:hypothetical protein
VCWAPGGGSHCVCDYCSVHHPQSKNHPTAKCHKSRKQARSASAHSASAVAFHTTAYASGQPFPRL